MRKRFTGPRTRVASRPRLLISASLSGVMVSLAFPRLQLTPLALVGLVPLLAALLEAGSLRRSAIAGFVWGCCFFGTLIYWIPEVMVQFGHLDRVTACIAYGLLVAVLALFPAAFSVVFGILCLQTKVWGWLVFPLGWVTVEWLRNLGPFGGFPWGQLGYAMVPHLGFMQLAACTGIYGNTFVVVLINSLIAWQFLESTRFLRKRNFTYLAAASVIAIWLAGCVFLWRAEGPAAGEAGLRVSVIQGNVGYENDLTEARQVFGSFYPEATIQAFKRGSRIVLWPESPTPSSFSQDAAYRQGIERLAQEGRGALVLNDISVVEEGGRTSYFNSALFLDDHGRLLARYDKNRLVPFGEYIPLAGLLGFTDALTREVGAFSAGKGPVVANLGAYPVGAFICYESIFPELVRGFSRGGASWLVNLTNDAWYGDTAAPHQHLQMAVVRAIENRRYLVRAANSGISAIIDPYGRIVRQQGLFERAVLEGEVFPQREHSVYTRLGDLLPWVCAIITLLWILSCLWLLFTAGPVAGKCA